jgi:hypothetical protein
MRMRVAVPRLLRMALSALCISVMSQNAFAYRPFDSTDADVAAPGEVELEFGPIGYLHEGSDKFLIAPAVIANLGIQGNREIVLEGRLSTPLSNDSGSESVLGDTALSLKQVHRRGSLQEETGPSVASECSILLPEVHGESRTGFGCLGIASQRWPATTAHVNDGFFVDREHNWARLLGLIVEGPYEWTVRPAVELLAERTNNGARTNSALAGVIWRKEQSLSFDFGIRVARVDNQDVYEVRAGLTWGFSADRR